MARDSEKAGKTAPITGATEQEGYLDALCNGSTWHPIDSTQRSELRRQILLQDRLLMSGTLMAGVAHEINNPIAWILSNLNYLKKQFARLKHNGSPTTQDWHNLEDVVMESIQGAERICDIVQLFKNVGGTHNELTNTPIDIHDVLNSVVDMASLECKFRAKVEKSFSSNMPNITANNGQLHQVFLNLIINAAQAIPEGNLEQNKISVSTDVDSTMLRVDIKDTGHGIKPEVMPHIFVPFFSTKPLGGSGLGLAICHEIIRDLGGKISVKSEFGKGATFSVYLPIASL